MYFAYFVLQVDSANKQGILLEMVQVLTDLDLVISKSYISSDGGWFMDGQCPLPTKLTSRLHHPYTSYMVPLSTSVLIYSYYMLIKSI